MINTPDFPMDSTRDDSAINGDDFTRAARSRRRVRELLEAAAYIDDMNTISNGHGRHAAQPIHPTATTAPLDHAEKCRRIRESYRQRSRTNSRPALLTCPAVPVRAAILSSFAYRILPVGLRVDNHVVPPVPNQGRHLLAKRVADCSMADPTLADRWPALAVFPDPKLTTPRVPTSLRCPALPTTR
ncbi:hypothetical protein R2Q81_10375 [Microbacterium aquimaris]|uniref:hypothetical protein n=1 Tax=Microbacterium aquimaris TaxID=459816 RepID=UPI002AD599D2|nr:hypothetical protein [Microbacterium aquimaris]MDZ8276351.1 hypothetical protein [Microbacterium aquimaris]